MSISLNITLDDRDLRRLYDLPKGKVRTATAKALTFTAQDAQKRLQVEAGSVFHLRNAWVPKGIRIRPATASTLSAQVGSIDKYMARHVVGEDKSPDAALSIRRTRDSRGRIATGGLLIPAYKGIASVGKHQTTRAKLARIEKQKRKTFQIRASGGNVLIVRRSSRKRAPLEILAGLSNDADLSPVWRIEVSVAGVVGNRFSYHFERAIGALSR